MPTLGVIGKWWIKMEINFREAVRGGPHRQKKHQIVQILVALGILLGAKPLAPFPPFIVWFLMDTRPTVLVKFWSLY